MNLVKDLNVEYHTYLISVIDNLKPKFEHKILFPELTLYMQLSIGILVIVLFLLIFVINVNIISSIFFKHTSYIYIFLKYFNTCFVSICTFLLIFKLYLSLKLENAVGVYVNDIKYYFYLENNNLGLLEYFVVFSSSFSDAILVLSFITGLICIELLGPKNFLKSLNNISVFYLFFLLVTIMVTTNNLLIMFISFEFIFLPTIFFVNQLGYSKKIDKAAEALFIWTLFGSFLVLCNLIYLYYTYNTLNYVYLIKKDFSDLETKWLFIIFLVGFGIKLPLAPLHFWLLKVHVESPTAFSVFLSGFLVKTALYCLFTFINLFNTDDYNVIIILWVLYSLVVGTLGLARQTDIKKLIAWATIQEMSFMLIFLMYKQMFLSHTCVLFVLLHGLMSSYMFYLVDIIQRRYSTRSLQYLRGLNVTLPKLSKHIWFLALLFSGFPLSAKFIIEWNLVSLMIETDKISLLLVIFFVNFLGVVFFLKHIFTVLYGTPEGCKEITLFVENQKKEYVMLNFITFFIIILVFLIYTFKWIKKNF